MHQTLRLAGAAAGLALGAWPVQAALQPYSVNGVDLVYSSVSEVSWTRDANLFRTLAAADAGLVNRIIALTPTFADPHFGTVRLSATDFQPGAGWMSWWGARAFTDYLNHVGYGGSTQWSLPTRAGNEMTELFRDELGGRVGTPRPDSAFFDNEPTYTHWLHDEHPTSPQYAWNFGYLGSEQVEYKFQNYAAWVMSPGTVAPVPEVPRAALLLAGLGALGMLARRRRIG